MRITGSGSLWGPPEDSARSAFACTRAGRGIWASLHRHGQTRTAPTSAKRCDWPRHLAPVQFGVVSGPKAGFERPGPWRSGEPTAARSIFGRNSEGSLLSVNSAHRSVISCTVSNFPRTRGRAVRLCLAADVLSGKERGIFRTLVLSELSVDQVTRLDDRSGRVCPESVQRGRSARREDRGELLCDGKGIAFIPWDPLLVWVGRRTKPVSALADVAAGHGRS
jgi:hypothetical protein